jgi:hypothetical protein
LKIRQFVDVGRGLTQADIRMPPDDSEG